MSEPNTPHTPPTTMPSSTIPTDVDLSRTTTAQSSRPSTPQPEMPPMMAVPRLRTPPPGERKTPTSHRRNRHAPVTGSIFGPMVSTPHGVMPLSPLPSNQSSPTPLVPRGNVGRLGTIGEEGAEAEIEEGQKESAEEKGKQAARKIQFLDETQPSYDKEKK